MMRKLSAVLLALALLLGAVLTVFAAETPDLTRRGSITFTVDHEGTLLNGGYLSIVRVGEIVPENGEYRYRLLPALTPGPALEDLESPSLAEELAQLAREKALPVQRAPIRSGEAKFTDLELGLYLVTQPEADATPDFYPIAPFLMSVPQLVDGYVYDVVAAPKMEPGSIPTQPTTEPTQPPPPTTTPPGPNLPQTGQLNWPVPLLIVSGLAFFATGWYLAYGKKERYEK